MDYIVKVYDSVRITVEFDKSFNTNYGNLSQIINQTNDVDGDLPDNPNTFQIPAHSLIHVYEDQMFNWIVLSYYRSLPIVIFKATCVCDLS